MVSTYSGKKGEESGREITNGETANEITNKLKPERRDITDERVKGDVDEDEATGECEGRKRSKE